MGFAWATTGLLMPLIGTLANALSIAAALAIASILLFPAAALVGLLPAERREGTAG